MAKKKSQPKRVQEPATAAAPEAAEQPPEGQEQVVEPLRKKVYRQELAKLQVQMFKLQAWTQGDSLRVVLVLEGLGPAGKKGVARRIAEGLDRRVARIVEPGMPRAREREQWQFQRFVEHFPAAGKITIFDGSWYHVAAIERALGLRSEEEFDAFLRSAAEFEQMLARSGVILFKYWFSAGDEEQDQRFRAHIDYLAKHKKLDLPYRDAALGPVPVAQVKDAVFALTDTDASPWYLVKADCKRRARLNCMAHLLTLIPTGERAAAGEGASPGPYVGEPVPAIAGRDRSVPEIY